METKGKAEPGRSREGAVICSSSSAEPRPSSGRMGSCDITRGEYRRECFEVEWQPATRSPWKLFWLLRNFGSLPPGQRSRHAQQTHDSARWKKPGSGAGLKRLHTRPRKASRYL